MPDVYTGEGQEFIYLFIYLIQYLSRGIQFSRASLNGALEWDCKVPFKLPCTQPIHMISEWNIQIRPQQRGIPSYSNFWQHQL